MKIIRRHSHSTLLLETVVSYKTNNISPSGPAVLLINNDYDKRYVIILLHLLELKKNLEI